MGDDSVTLSSDAPVLVIGAAGIDIVGRLKSDLSLGTSNPARIRASFGGVAHNVAENLARLGQPVTLLTAVGDDAAGDQLLEQVSSAGVDASAAIRTAEQPTGSYLGVVNAKGELQVALDDMRVISSLSPTYLNDHAGLFREAALLFLDANLSRDALRTAVSLARRAGIPICADPASATLAHRLRPYLSSLFLVTPNAGEASVLCERPVEAGKRRQAMEAARCLVSQGVKIAVVTLAQFGVCYATSQTRGQIPAMRTEIVDPTGAGDALTATAIFALLNNIPLDDAIRLAVTAATLTLRHLGTVLPDLTLEKLYDELVI